MAEMKEIRLRGWKSIRDATIPLRRLNVFIGANGAGKSNLIDFFRLLNEMMGGRFQTRVGTVGGAESLLHNGSRQTREITAELRFASEVGEVGYIVCWVPIAGNALLFAEESLDCPRPGFDGPFRDVLHGGHTETRLHQVADAGNRTAAFVRDRLNSWRLFHFHDTSLLGPMRRNGLIDRNRFLDPDGANLASMLYLYQERYPAVYRRILAAIRAIVPYFDTFVLEPSRLNPREVVLLWRAKNSAYEMGPHQFSDGTLRAIALVTLLLQPDENLPDLIILDEPELGLHPAALAILAGLLKAAADSTQVLIATQSSVLLDHFQPEDIVTVNFRDGASTFERLDAARLEAWLGDVEEPDKHTLSELWQHNIIGGGPY